MQVKYKALAIVGAIAILTSGLAGWSSYSTNSAVIEGAKQRELRGSATLIQNDPQEQAPQPSAALGLKA